MKKNILLSVLVLASVFCNATGLSEVVLQAVPEWVNLRHYRGERYPIDVRLLAQKEHLTLRDAVEVQNHYYDMVDDRENSTTPEQKFRKALDRVKNSENKYENVWNGEKIAKARFVIVFDLDDTLLSQYYTIGVRGDKYWDIKLQEGCLSKWSKPGTRRCANLVKLTPNWREAIVRIKALGGAVVFFTAKKDVLAQRIYRKWMFNPNTHISEIIDGFMTKNHLILIPGKNYDRGRAFPTKDMEIIDPTLSKVVLVDDSPSKTYQPLNVRFFHKYDPDIHLADNISPEIEALYQNLLLLVVAEVEDSVKYINDHKDVSFVEAYKPYSLMGRVTFDALLDAGVPRKKALRLVRETKGLIKPRF